MKKIWILLLILFAACNQEDMADLVIYNGTIYTVNEGFAVAEAMAIKDGRILATGPSEFMLSRYPDAEKLNLQQEYVYPGLIDPHCHFLGYGMNLKAADLVGTGSWEEILEILQEHAQQFSEGWLTARGWDQNDWEQKEFPDKTKLDQLFPHRPVFLTRIDGHAAVVNQAALDIAGIDSPVHIEGGSVVFEDGEPTGILIDNAIAMVREHIPPATNEEKSDALEQAQQQCFAVGLTSVHDAGLDAEDIFLIKDLQEKEKLRMRIYAMLNPGERNYEKIMSRGYIQTPHLQVRSIKLYADGALGSRGALLLEEYSDDPGNHGISLADPEWLKEQAGLALENDYQVNTHAIGDSANRLILNLYAGLLEPGNDKRWRIEHAQTVHPDDFGLFAKYNIVPSVQSTHATSDMKWAIKRLGPERLKNSYALRKLLEQNGWIPNGSDFPVEDINPLYGFYTAVARKDLSGTPEGGFQMEHALTREEALKAMTLWAAKAGFEEDAKGSLAPGKFADFVILDKDIMTIPIEEVPNVRVVATYLAGEEVYPITER